jgi:hypothetical protein
MVSPSPQRQSRSFEFAVTLVVLVFSTLVLVGCGGGNSIVGGPGTPTPTPTPIPTPTPPSTPATLEVSVPNVIVPPNGIYQYQVLLTEPKPIGNSSSRPTLPSAPTGPVRGVAVNDATGQAAGVALIDPAGNVNVSLISPNGSLGTNNTYPLFTMTMPVNSNATPGSSFPASLGSATFLDGSGNSYTILANTAGSLTIGDPTTGAQSITDVIPGGGLLADRSTIQVFGIGFTANTRITIEGTTVLFVPGETTFVSSNEIDVKICNGTVDPLAVTCPNNGGTFQLDGERVRAINKDTNATVEYFSYPRTVDDVGTSANSLVTEVHAMFSRQTYTTATIPYVNDATHFTGMALQNTSTADATFSVDLLDSNGAVLPGGATGQTLHAGTRMARDINDWIPAIQGTPAKVRVTVTAGPSTLQMLGLLGDTAAGTVTPVVVTGQ